MKADCCFSCSWQKKNAGFHDNSKSLSTMQCKKKGRPYSTGWQLSIPKRKYGKDRIFTGLLCVVILHLLEIICAMFLSLDLLNSQKESWVYRRQKNRTVFIRLWMLSWCSMIHIKHSIMKDMVHLNSGYMTCTDLFTNRVVVINVLS